MVVLFSIALLLLAVLPAAMVARNLGLFLRPNTIYETEADADSDAVGVSVLIPARNEASGIRDAIASVLQSSYEKFEVIVLDDHSTDETREIVAHLATTDDRLAWHASDTLPDRWNGKQHACWQLAERARFETLLFMDADVRLSADALPLLVGELRRTDVDLLSGFPRQIMQSTSEHMLIPMMYFLLLGYLPLDRMRATTNEEFGAGCGQLFLAKRESYFLADGHRSIQGSRHDGLRLPRSFRKHGLRTDLVDASEIAQVRMYAGVGQVTHGILKNATEGIANSRLIGLFSVLLLGGSVLPIFGFAHALFYGWIQRGGGWWWATWLLGAATLVGWIPRILIARRLGHSIQGVILHPIAVAWFVGLQWIAFLRSISGAKPLAWRGRR